VLTNQKDFKLAMKLSDQGRFNEAKTAMLGIHEKYQACFDFYYYLGAIYFHLHDWENAVKLLYLSVPYKELSPLPYHLLGQIFIEIGDFNKAILNFHEAARLDNNISPDIQNDLGCALQKSGRQLEAIAFFNSALKLDPSFRDAYNNKGICLCSMNRYEEAEEEFHKAVNLDPSFFVSHINHALSFQMMARFDEALKSLNQSIKLNPNSDLNKWNKATLLLLLDQYEEAWPLYEFRWKTVLVKNRAFKEPIWLGDSSIDGKKILIHVEQGFGDVVQFGRYIPLLKSLGAKVTFEVPPELYLLMQSIDDVKVIHKNEFEGSFDFQCPIASLPLAFKTNIYNIPSHDYLKNFSHNRSLIWNKRTPPKNTRLNVGICWSGSNTLIEHYRRSVDHEELDSLLMLPVNFHVLQKQINPEEKIKLDSLGINYYDDMIKDFNDTASLIEHMDLVITIDTSVAHLASSLNKPTWIMIPFVPDWRWGINRIDCPWYPTAKLYRQTIASSWVEPLNNIIKDLQNL
jgi:Tfp pilus assembly protein PilF